jgi:hypothetical protein
MSYIEWYQLTAWGLGPKWHPWLSPGFPRVFVSQAVPTSYWAEKGQNYPGLSWWLAFTASIFPHAWYHRCLSITVHCTTVWLDQGWPILAKLTMQSCSSLLFTRRDITSSLTMDNFPSSLPPQLLPSRRARDLSHLFPGSCPSHY